MTTIATAVAPEYEIESTGPLGLGQLHADESGEGWFIQVADRRIWVTQFTGIPFVAAIFQARKVLRDLGFDAHFVNVSQGLLRL